MRAPILAMVLMTAVIGPATAQSAAQDMPRNPEHDAGHDPDAASVTTDTAAYCLHLAARIEMAHDVPPLAQALWLEGRSLCDHGHVRAGLARLRRAMMILHGGDNH